MYIMRDLEIEQEEEDLQKMLDRKEDEAKVAAHEQEPVPHGIRERPRMPSFEPVD